MERKQCDYLEIYPKEKLFIIFEAKMRTNFNNIPKISIIFKHTLNLLKILKIFS